jgi:putative FmdB family regulatory protein
MPPIYEYRCEQEHAWEVIKPMSASQDSEACRECGALGKKVPARFGFTGAGDWNRQEFNHGLGCVATPKQAEKIAKDRGLIAVGNESPDKMHAKFDKDRADKREQRYRDAADLK